MRNYVKYLLRASFVGTCIAYDFLAAVKNSNRYLSPLSYRIYSHPNWFIEVLIKALNLPNYHRTDGPACEKSDGTGGRWYKYGLLHRENGPALVTSTDVSYYFKYGLLHREDGPAIEGLEKNYYYLYGQKVHPVMIFKRLLKRGVDLTPYLLSEDDSVRKAVSLVLKGAN